MLLLIGTIFFRNEECESFELTVLRRGEERREEKRAFRAPSKRLRNKNYKNYAGNDKGMLADREVHLRIRPLNRQWLSRQI